MPHLETGEGFAIQISLVMTTVLKIETVAMVIQAPLIGATMGSATTSQKITPIVSMLGRVVAEISIVKMGIEIRLIGA